MAANRVMALWQTCLPDPSAKAVADLEAKALAEVERISGHWQRTAEPDFWLTRHEFNMHLVSDPFVIWTDSLHRGRFPASKTDLVQQMIDLENEARTNPGKAVENYLRLSTAWLNCTYGGKSWMMFSYGNSVSERDNPSFYCPPSGEMADIYYGSARATEYLKKVEMATKDREILSKVAFLKSRIAWNNYDPAKDDASAWNALEWDEQDKFLFKKEMSFYKNWAVQYKDTKSWSEMTGICPVLRTYFGK